MDALGGQGGGVLTRAARDLARCVVPVECAGCATPDVRLCLDCAAVWWDPPLRCEEGAPRLMVEGEALMPVWSLAALDGDVHEVIAAWKDAGRRDLDRFLSHAMARQVHTLGLADCAIVPVPSRPGAARRRGANLTRVLAAGAARALMAPLVPALTIPRGESRGASARQRWRAAHGAVRVTRIPPLPAFLVDDVVTTGATLAACGLALREHGVPVLGAGVLACA